MTARKAKSVAAAAGSERPAAKSGMQLGRAGAAPLGAYDDAAAFNQATMEALLASSVLVAKGVEDIVKAWLELTQRSVENGTAAAKAIAKAKTLREVVAVQSDYACASLDSLVAESGKVSEISVKVADEAMRPIRARVDVAVERLLKTAA